MSLNLYDWQKEFSEFSEKVLAEWSKTHSSPAPIYLSADVGAGKTVGALSAAKKMGYVGKNIVVVSPVSAFQSWKTDGAKFGLKFTEGVNLFSYDKFRSKFMPPPRKRKIQQNPIGADLLILDEIHKVKNVKSKITKTVKRVFGEVQKIGLSGTPADKLHELYAQFECLSPGFWSLHGIHSYMQFLYAFFYIDVFNNPKSLKHGAREKIMNIVSPYMYSVKLSDFSEMDDFSDVDVKEVAVDGVPGTAYEQEKIALYESENPLSGFSMADRIAHGIDPLNNDIFDDFRINKAVEMLDEKTILFVKYLPIVNEMKRRFGDSAYYITGQNKKDLKDVISKGGKPVIATFSVKEGANLQKHYNKLIFMSYPLAYRDFVQAAGRIHRNGQKADTEIIVITSDLEIDSHLKRIIRNKESVHSYIKNFRRF